MDNTDDEALNWAGDEARQRGGGTWSVPKRREGASLSPSSDKVAVPELVEGVKLTDQVVSTPSTGSGTAGSGAASSVALVVTGIFAGIYLLFTVAWLITALRDPIQIADPLGNAMFIAGLWLAVAAGPAVFAASLMAGRSRLWVRFVCLFAGALVLIPWPYFTWAG
ncbi:MAG: hypothetical protein RLZZ600_209 [Actinomycetota bacterium]|jgi:hypothetical protein